MVKQKEQEVIQSKQLLGKMVARRAENRTEGQIAKVKKQTIISIYSKDKTRSAEQ